MADEWTLVSRSGDLVITTGAYGITLEEPPEVSTDEDTQDTPIHRQDGMRPGEDFVSSQTAVLNVRIATEDLGPVDGLRETFLRHWRADETRQTPGAVSELVAPSGRRLIGRSRRALVDDSKSQFGLCRITAAFDAVSPDWFGPQQEVHSEPLGTISGGLTAPLTAPLTTVGDGTSRTLVEVGGSASTPLRLTFTGPAVNPQVTIGPIQVALATSLAWDEQIIIDARPWRHTVTRSWSTSARAESAAGALTARSTPMSRMRLDPGLYELVYHATTTSADAGVRVGFADAHHTY